MGRFNWLWYDVTTFEPYTEETSYENSLLVQQSGSLALSSLIHVFRSLTANAKGVFLLIENYQLEHSKEGNYAGMWRYNFKCASWSWYEEMAVTVVQLIFP